jgi:hypothetical protein
MKSMKSTTLQVLLACAMLASIHVFALGQGKGAGSKNSAESERIAKEMSEQSPQIRLSDLRLVIKYANKLRASGVDNGEVRRLGMEAMAKGKALLPEEEQREMEDLNQQILDSYSPDTLSRIERLRIVMSKGQPMTKADQEFLRIQFKKGFESLPTEDKTRLQDLNGKAVRTFLSTQ